MTQQRSSIAPGAQLPVLNKGPYHSSHLVRWCAAQQNWDKIHYDRDFTIDVAGLPERVINGALKQHVIVQFLNEALPDGWVWTVRFKFLTPDLIGDSLEVRGVVAAIEPRGDVSLAKVEFEIWNVGQQKVTTSGSACVGLGVGGADVPAFPAEVAIGHETRPAGEGVPDEVGRRVGEEWERVSSRYPVDLSRLRLFAAAVGGLSPVHYDLEAAAGSPHGTVVAAPLFPLHALEGEPDALPLSQDPAAMGREGVNEMGRNIGRMLGLPGAGMINGGSSIEIHSLLRLGETVHASGRLLSADVKTGRSAEPMLITEAVNEYFAGDRLLVRELQTTMYRKIFG